MLVRTGLTLEPGEFIDAIDTFVMWIVGEEQILATVDIRSGSQITLSRLEEGEVLQSVFSNDLEIITNVLLTMREVLGGHPLTTDDFVDMEETPLYRLVT